jgi:prevent-host-death family protein
MNAHAFKTVSAAEAARNFAEFNDAALREPVVVTRNGKARTVLVSVETFERYLANERGVMLAKDTPEMFLEQIEAFAAGPIDRAGIGQNGDSRAEWHHRSSRCRLPSGQMRSSTSLISGTVSS